MQTSAKQAVSLTDNARMLRPFLNFSQLPILLLMPKHFYAKHQPPLRGAKTLV